MVIDGVDVNLTQIRVRFAELGHPHMHVRPNDRGVEQHSLRPFGAHLGAEQCELGWNVGFVTQQRLESG